MQLGMIGLGRMGANMVRRLMKGGHECVAFDFNADSVAKIAGEGATGAASLEELVQKLAAPRAVWIMVPAGKPTEDTVVELSKLLSPGDAIIDGGNSFFKDPRRKGHQVHGLWHERRRLGSRARVLPHDRWRRRHGQAP